MQALDLSCDRLDAVALAQHLEQTGVGVIRLKHMRGDAVIGRKRADISRHNIAGDAFREVRVEFLIEVLDLVAQAPVSQGTASATSSAARRWAARASCPGRTGHK